MSSDNNSDNFQNGNYTVVSIALNTNGTKITDEIIEIAAYTPGNQCTIFKLPFYEDDPEYSCVLENEGICKFNHPDSSKSAFIEFLNWIENIKQSDENSLGIILLYHEDSKFVPYAINEAVKKYGLLSCYVKNVECYANIYTIIKDKYPNDADNYSLRYLSFSVLGNDQLISNVAINAKLTYEVIHRLTENEMKKNIQQQQEGAYGVQSTVNDAMVKMIMKYADTIEDIYTVSAWCYADSDEE